MPVQILEPDVQCAPLPVQAFEPAAQHFASLVPAVTDWLHAGPEIPMLHVDPVAPVEAVPPPGNDIVVLDNDEHEAAPLPSPTPAVVEIAASHALAFVPRGYPLMPSPTGRGSPATPPSSPRAGFSRRVLALGVPLASPPSSSRSGCAGTWSPAALGLANGASNGVAPVILLAGDSSNEDERGGSSSCRRWCGRPVVGVSACVGHGIGD